MKFVITALAKTRDVIEADDPDKALVLFKAKYPAMLDKQSSISRMN